jgi:hypothetical protein
MLIILVFSLILTACNADGTSITIVFHVDEEEYSTVKVGKDGTFTMPADPTMDNNTFIAWYLDDGIWSKPLTMNAVADFPLTENSVINVYAKWKNQFIFPVDGFDVIDSGSVKEYDIGAYTQVVYDVATNKLIVARNVLFDIYDASTLIKENTYKFTTSIGAMDADGGLLVVAGGSVSNVYVYDLSTNELMNTIRTNQPVQEVAIDGDMVIYAGSDQHCSIYFHNISTDYVITRSSHYEPRLIVNRQDHIVYIAETAISSSDLIYYTSNTGEKIFQSYSYQFGYNYTKPYFDGMYVHYYGKVFDRFTGLDISGNSLSTAYNQHISFEPAKTIYCAEKFDLVIGTKSEVGTPEQDTLAVYNKLSDSWAYDFECAGDIAIPFKSGKLMIVEEEGTSIFIIDLN